MTNCSFNQFKDLVGVHEALFSTLLTGGTVQQAVSNLKDYLSRYNQDFSNFTQDRLEEFASDFSEVVRLGLEIYSEFNKDARSTPNFDEQMANYDPGNSIIANTIKEFLPENLTFKNTNLQSEATESEVQNSEPSLREKENPINEISSIVVTTADNQPIDFRNTPGRTAESIRNRYYIGVQSAYNEMFNNTWNNLYNDVILPFSIGDLSTNSQLNAAIANIKNDLFNSLLEDDSDHKDLFINNFDANVFKQVMDGVANKYEQWNNGKGLTVADVRTLSLNEAYAREKAQYNAYVLLSNFDSLISDVSSGLIQVNESMRGFESGYSNKYYPKLNDTKARKNFREDDIDMSGMTQLSDFYEDYIGNMNMYDLDGNLTTQRLDPLSVVNTISKFSTGINLFDPLGSLKQQIQETLKSYFNNTLPQNFNKVDAKILLTLYMNTFRGDIDVEKANRRTVKDVIKTEIGGRGLNTSMITRLDSSMQGPSLSTSFRNFDSSSSRFNLAEMITANMLKLDATAYGEITVDPATGAMKRTTFLNREVDSQFYMLKSLGIKAALKGEAQLQRSLSRSTKNTGYTISQNGYDFKIKTISGNEITYNVETGKFTTNGVVTENLEVAFKMPESNVLLQGTPTATLQQTYPDYFSIIDMFDNFVGQPLSAQDHTLLDMFREMSDYKDGKGNPRYGHLETIIKIAGNFSYLSHVNAKGLKGNYNGSIGTVRDAINQGQRELGVTGFKFDDLWDAKNNTFKIELSKSAHAGYGALKEYARILNNYYNTSVKPVTMNSDGNALPTYILGTLINRVKQITASVKNQGLSPKRSWIDNNGLTKQRATKQVFRNNIFITNDGLIKSIEINAGIKNKTGDTSTASKMTLIELATSSIKGNFLNSYLDQSDTSYQTTNFSDKGKHSTVVIDRNSQFTFMGENGIPKTKKWKDLSVSDLQHAYFNSMDDYYKSVVNNITSDYEEVITADSSPLAQAFYENNDYLAILNRDANGQIETPTAELLNDEDFAKAYNTYVALTQTSKLPFPKNDADRIKHINTIIQDVPTNVLSAAFAKQGVDFIDTFYAEVGTLDNEFKGKTTLNNNIEYYLNNFSANNMAQRLEGIEADFLRSLDRMGFSLDLRDNSGKEDFNIKRFLYELGNGTQEQRQLINDIKKNFLDQKLGTLKNSYTNAAGKTVLNPILKRYLYEHLLVNRNFQLLTVGSSLEHPHKVKPIATGEVGADGKPIKRLPNAKELDSGRLTSQNKRMVILQASHHPVLLNTLKGLGGMTKSVTVIDPKRDVDTAWGLSSNVEVTDGSTFSNPIYIMLFGESLAGEHSGLAVKSIRGELNSMTGTAVLLKHAEYAVTNMNILRGYSDNSTNKFLKLMERTMSEDFTTLYGGVSIDYDLTKDYNGKAHNILKDNNLHFVFNKSLNEFNNATSLPENGDLVRVEGMTKTGPSTYSFQYENVSEGTKFTVDAEVKNSYDLWRLLGGERSVEKIDSEVGRFEHTADTVLDGFVPSMKSSEAVKDYVNTVGVKLKDLDKIVGETKAKEIKAQYKAEHLQNVSPADENFMNQLTVIQPLKNALIGQISFKSAIKTGASNPISMDTFLNSAKKLPINRHKSTFYGMQLNAEHEIGEDSKVIEQSQIITALSFVGTSPEHAITAFNGINEYVTGTMINLLPKITGMKMNEVDKDEVKKVMRRILSRALETRDNMGVANTVVELLKKEISENSSPIFNIPISSPDLYNTVFTTISNFLTSEGIRRNLPGLAAVLKAHNSFMGVRNVYITDEDGVTREEPMTEEDYQRHIEQNPDRERIKKYDENPDFDVDLLNTVIEYERDAEGNVIKENSIYLSNIATYLAVKQKMKNNPQNYAIDLEAKRELKATTFSWELPTTEDGVKRRMSSLDLPVSMLANAKNTFSKLSGDLLKLNEKIKIQTLKLAQLSSNPNVDPALITAETNIINLMRQNKTKLENETGVLKETFSKIVELSGINEVIRNLNTVKRFDDANNLVDVESIVVNPITDINNVTAEHTAILKNVLNKQYRVINEGFTKPSVFDIDFYAANTNLQVYSNTGKLLGTLAQHIANNPGLTIEQALGTGDIYFKSKGLLSKPGEIMAPSIHKDKLGLSANHTPANTSVNTFFRNLQKLSRPTTELHDLFATSGNGTNTYIVFEGSANHKKLLEKHNLSLDENVNIQKNPLNESEYNVYNYKGEKGIRVPFDKLYTANINNALKNYIVIPKGGEANITALLRSNGGVFNKIVPNLMATDKLLDVSLMVDSGILKTSPKITENLGKLREMMGSTFRQLSVASKKQAAMNGVNTFDYFNDAWALEQVGDYQMKMLTLKRTSREYKVYQNLVNKLREYSTTFKAYQQSGDQTMITTLTSMLDEFKAMDKGSVINDREKIMNRANKSLGHFSKILQDLQNQFYDEGSKRDMELAKRQYAAYKASLHISAARIPGQHFQSFMGQRIVGFTNDEQNIAYVSPMHMLITGEDFDIDKAYLSYFGLDKKDGTLKGWTKAWRDSSPEELAVSMSLPIPTKISIGETVVKDSLLALDTDNILALVQWMQGDKSLEVFQAAAKALTKVTVLQNKINKFDDVPTPFVIRPDVSQEIIDQYLPLATQAILEYNNNTALDPETDDYFEQGYANAIVRGIVATGNDLRNTNIQTSPVDFGDYDTLAQNSQKGIVMKQMSYENPLDVYAAQVYAMVGKDVIAIAAAGGLKPYGTIAYNFTHIKNRGVGPKMSLLGKEFNGDDIKSHIISSISLDDPFEMENVADYLLNLASPTSKLGVARESGDANLLALAKQFLMHELNKVNTMRGDAALSLSAILSAATDNAKELILGRINAGPDTVGYYLAASILDIDAAEIGAIMQSDTVENALKLAGRNLFKSDNTNFESALKQLQSGSLNIRSYFDIDVAYSIQRAITDSGMKFGEYSLDDYLLLNAPGKITGAPAEKFLKEIKRNPYAVINSLLNAKLAKKANINYEELLDKVLEMTTNIQQMKAPEGTMNGTKVVIEGANDTNSEYDEYTNDDDWEGDMNQEEYEGDNDFDSGEDYYEDDSMVDDFFDNDESFKSVYSKTMPASILLRRFLNDSKTLLANVDDDVIRAVQDLELLKNDLNILGRFASVNQGVKNNFFDLYKYGELIKTYLEENFPEFMLAHSNMSIAEIIDGYYNNLDFKLELDSAFRVSSNPEHKFTSNINLLEMLFNTGHMSAMQNISFKNAEWTDNISLKSRIMQDLADNSGVKLSRKNYGILQNYANDVIINDVLERLGTDNESDVIINAFKGQTVDPNEDVIPTQNYEMDVRTIKGRNDFLNWFESTVIPTLQTGHTILSDGQSIDIGVSDNNFLKSLTIDSKMDRLLGERYHFYNVRMDTNKRSDTRSLLLNDILIDDFAALRNVRFNGRPLTDLFFLYNLFIFKGRGSKGSFTNFLATVSNGYQDDTIMSKYMNRLGWMDSQSDYRAQSSYIMDDLYNKGYAKDTSYLPETYQGPAVKKLYKDPNDKWLSAVYKWEWNVEAKNTSLGSSEGSYKMLDTPKYNERTINITNVRDISDNYKSSISDSLLRKTLSKMFNNNFEIKLDENC